MTNRRAQDPRTKRIRDEEADIPTMSPKGDAPAETVAGETIVPDAGATVLPDDLEAPKPKAAMRGGAAAGRGAERTVTADSLDDLREQLRAKAEAQKPKKKTTWPVWVLAFLVLGGVGFGVAWLIMHQGGAEEGGAAVASAEADAGGGSAGDAAEAGDAQAGDAAAAADAAGDAAQVAAAADAADAAREAAADAAGETAAADSAAADSAAADSAAGDTAAGDTAAAEAAAGDTAAAAAEVAGADAAVAAVAPDAAPADAAALDAQASAATGAAPGVADAALAPSDGGAAVADTLAAGVVPAADATPPKAFVANPVEAARLNEDGLARRKAGDHAGALKLYEQALAADPNHVWARYNYACELALAGRGKDALAELTRLHKLGTADARRALGAARKDSDFRSIKDTGQFFRLTNF